MTANDIAARKNKNEVAAKARIKAMFTDLLPKTDSGRSQFKPVRETRAWRRRRRAERLARVSVFA